ncbi:hypothetical protein [Brevibacillus agri]|uniref:hypothetical protein n=1 Tax=Brevibacillus agri TaxID=51101 RepID=UPI000A96A2D1|nr:hypothetical protein [Brevibacillus agri]
MGAKGNEHHESKRELPGLHRSSLDDEQIEKQHQFQMFPTPDEQQASEVIRELKD